MSYLSDVERHVGRLAYRAIQQMLDRGLGQPVLVHEVSKDVHQKAYGAASGSRTAVSRTITAIVTGDDFFPMDAARGGTFSEGWMWTHDKDVVGAGEQVEFVGVDGRSRFYKVGKAESIGKTVRVFTRYRLAAVDQP